MLETPILFLIFNRPELTSKVFSRIREARPKQLFIAADGPRTNVEQEEEQCLATRTIASQIDWPCEVELLFRKKNLGCAQAVSEAITWFFTNVEAGIILEDDCLPNISFFKYCQDLLNHYNDDKRVMMISGRNNLEISAQDNSYFFASYGSIWGWATWKRAWEGFDVKMSDWPKVKEKDILNTLIADSFVRQWKMNAFQEVASKRLNTWDIPWGLHMLLQNGLSIVPTVNLVKNIGYGELATHTSDGSMIDPLQTFDMPFPLKYPDHIYPDHNFDRQVIEVKISKYKTNILSKIGTKVRKIVQ